MTHHSIVRSARNTASLRKWLWVMLPGTLAAVLVLTPQAHAQNTPAPATSGNAAGAAGAAGATGSGAFNPSADISRAVSRDTTDAAIQNNWNSIMRAPVQAKSEDKPAETPRRNRRGITPGISTN
ncbi:hypothetical protein [Pandoraea fibrosis]|uniref:Uncharacterized protein n=1 Tax=Pandoraea fibrosis TaxID=1891094 RepID=A0A5E4WQG6_9BURK|nr:hypothetical protein [Pandoraea fibrosis]QHE94638.1 hypothetical protein PJ20_024625 [Pandoraea fibrosis]QHF15476.1 hypothetical protein PI93_024630 [Pandoraea fibrosis]VVE26039.1 hypothetical protein PFI31113_03360 [Pandoraea fibrosis]